MGTGSRWAQMEGWEAQMEMANLLRLSDESLVCLCDEGDELVDDVVSAVTVGAYHPV